VGLLFFGPEDPRLDRLSFMLTRPLVLLLVLLLATLARADEPPLAWSAADETEIARRAAKALPVRARGRDWQRAQGASITVFSEVDARFSAEASLFMDRLRERFQGVFSGERRVDRRPDLYVFADRAGFEAEVKAKARGWYRYEHEGANRFREHALYTFVDAPAERRLEAFPRSILVHEGTHMLVRELLGTEKIPPWLDEGLATYFQLWRLGETNEANLEGRRLRLVRGKDLKAARAEGRLPSLAALLDRAREPGPKLWNRDDFGPIGHADYAAAEALMVYLMDDPKRRKLVSRALDLARGGDDPRAALVGGGAKAAAALEAAWLAYVDEVLAPVVK